MNANQRKCYAVNGAYCSLAKRDNWLKARASGKMIYPRYDEAAPYALKSSQYYYWQYRRNRNYSYDGAAFGSDSLMRACWNQYLAYLRSAIDYPQSDNDVLGWLDSIASERVNNPRSQYYIYG